MRSQGPAGRLTGSAGSGEPLAPVPAPHEAPPTRLSGLRPDAPPPRPLPPQPLCLQTCHVLGDSRPDPTVTQRAPCFFFLGASGMFYPSFCSRTPPEPLACPLPLTHGAGTRMPPVGAVGSPKGLDPLWVLSQGGPWPPTLGRAGLACPRASRGNGSFHSSGEPGRLRRRFW